MVDLNRVVIQLVKSLLHRSNKPIRFKYRWFSWMSIFWICYWYLITLLIYAGAPTRLQLFVLMPVLHCSITWRFQIRWFLLSCSWMGNPLISPAGMSQGCRFKHLGKLTLLLCACVNVHPTYHSLCQIMQYCNGQITCKYVVLPLITPSFHCSPWCCYCWK